MPKNYYKGKKILVTGGVGSIGSQIVRKLLTLDPTVIRIFDNNETGLFDLEQNLNSSKIRTLVGDIRDKDRLAIAMDGIDFVFHAAALKHVPLCEYNPFDAIKTNVLGTQNVLEAALAQEVEKVINISTDKAVNPTNVMGATKLLTERLTIAANHYHGDKRTLFSSVRFGNVLNSRGSVIPLFLKQIQECGPVTVTDKRMTRFFMDIPTAVNLIITANMIAKGGEIFILKMPAINILDLAEVMTEYYAPRYGYSPEMVKIDIMGKRNGEKIFEELVAEEDSERAYEYENMIIIYPQTLKFEESVNIPIGRKCVKSTMKLYSSSDVPCLPKDQILDIMSKILP